MGFREKLKWHKVGLRHHRPAKFGTAQWQDEDKISIWFVLYRLVIFLFFWSFFVYDLMNDYDDNQINFYMIYLTNWTYLSAITDIALQLMSALTAAFRCHQGIKPLVPWWMYQSHWVLVNISHTVAPLVTLMYWAGVFPFLDIPVTYPDIHLHLLTTLYTTADLFIHGTPRRFHHVVYPLGFGISYLLFSIIYYLCGGVDGYGNTGIYPILDWAKPGLSTGTAVVACLLVLALHAGTWGLVKLRLRLHGRWRGRQVTVEAGFDPNSNSGGGSGDGGEEGNDVENGVFANGSNGANGTKSGEPELYINVDVGDSGAAKAAGDSAAPRSEPEAKRAFDNAGLEVDDDGGVHFSEKGSAREPVV